jgi:ABC-2 type transport system ATP-binding protein
MTAAIHTDHLSKRYGSRLGLVELDLTVERGEVFGFLGPNGAGKTTTIRTLLDLIRPSSGRATVLDRDSHVQSLEIRRRVGYLPGELALYDTLTRRELLRYVANLRGSHGGGVDARYVEALIERLDLDPSRQIRTLSKGNKQKVGLVQAFMHQPELLILDEPTSGLDPLVQQEFHRLALEAKAEGRTVFLSSHVLGEVERIADRVGILRDGRLIAVDAVAAIRERARHHVDIRFGRPVPAGVFAGLPGVREATIEGDHGRFAVEGSMDGLIKAAAGFEVVTIVSHEPDLEEVFLDYYRGSDRHAA